MSEKHQHHEHNHNHSHENQDSTGWKSQINLIIALVILFSMLIINHFYPYIFPKSIAFSIYFIAYILAGKEVLKLAFIKAKRGDFFNEFFLMSIATVGAFAIGSYSEGVAVMVFYAIGEWFQDSAIQKAKNNIKSLLDIRPDTVTILINEEQKKVKPKDVAIGDFFIVKAGEKVALDGILISEKATFNTAALTGESKPDNKKQNDMVLAGMINLNSVATIKVTTLYKDSKLSKILELVQDATSKKSKTQLFISRFAKVYTPIVFILAILVLVLPYFFVDQYIFKDWLYKALVFLVVSCPCGLVVSIPLGYFGGISLASKNGILFKGGNFLDLITKIDTVLIDKTGTLTKGVFEIQHIESLIDKNEFLEIATALESQSTHPIALAISAYKNSKFNKNLLSDVQEISGHGIRGRYDDYEVLAGNTKLLDRYHILYPNEIEDIKETIVAIAKNNQYIGYILVADEIKEDAKLTIEKLKNRKIQPVMLSGDKQDIVLEVAKNIGVENAFGNLLPADKVYYIQKFKNENKTVAFIGDGINDSPSIALADIGIAMGGLGSDAAIETADVVIQNDQPSKILSAIEIGKITKTVVWQNISFALIIKIIVLILGVYGLANLWEAVIADVGVALLAILNAYRIQFKEIKI